MYFNFSEVLPGDDCNELDEKRFEKVFSDLLFCPSKQPYVIDVILQPLHFVNTQWPCWHVVHWQFYPVRWLHLAMTTTP